MQKIKTHHHKTVLASGLTAVSENIPGAASIAIGLWVARGSRDEAKASRGMCHFIEHMAFKGTKTRSARDIALCLESVGGHLDAFTSKEETCFYARVQQRHQAKALELIADIVTNLKFDPRDIAREKMVIAEEIKSVEDTPDDLVYELFAEAMFDGHPLSFPILGAKRDCREFTAPRVKGFWRECYRPPHMMVSLAGQVDHREFCRMLEKYFPGRAQKQELAVKPFVPDFKPSLKMLSRKISQAHICLGVPALATNDPRRYVLLVLNTILGGGMSSRLFQKIREQSGLAYSVFSFADLYRDTGVLGVYLGVSPDKTDQALALALKEIRQMSRNPVSRAELDNAKEQLKGGLFLGMESTSNRMMRLAKMALHHEPYLTPEETAALIDQVTIDQVQQMAQSLLQPQKLAAAILGPLNQKKYSLAGLQEQLG